MDSEPATITETSATPDEAWRRFTLLDLMVLFTGHEAALGIMKWHGLFDHVEWSLLMVLVFSPVFFILGAIFSIPAVVLIQFFPRGRRVKLGGGEIYAVINVFYWSLVALGFLIRPENRYFDHLFWGTSCIAVCSFVIGTCMLLGDLFSLAKFAPCYWLGLYGYLLCLISDYVVFHSIFFHSL